MILTFADSIDPDIVLCENRVGERYFHDAEEDYRVAEPLKLRQDGRQVTGHGAPTTCRHLIA